MAAPFNKAPATDVPIPNAWHNVMDTQDESSEVMFKYSPEPCPSVIMSWWVNEGLTELKYAHGESPLTPDPAKPSSELEAKSSVKIVSFSVSLAKKVGWESSELARKPSGLVVTQPRTLAASCKAFKPASSFTVA